MRKKISKAGAQKKPRTKTKKNYSDGSDSFPIFSRNSREKRTTFSILTGVIVLFIGLFVTYIEIKKYDLYDAGDRSLSSLKVRSPNFLEQKSSKGQATKQHSFVANVLSEDFKQVEGFSFSQKVSHWASRLEVNSALRGKLHTATQGVKTEDSHSLIPQKHDSTTYLETVIALAKSASSEEFIKKLLQFRYRDGQIGFFHRNHFIEVDWIPNNQKAGLLKDTTLSFAQQWAVPVHFEEKKIDRSLWFKEQMKKGLIHSEIQLSSSDSSWTSPALANVPYISLEDILKHLDAIPSATVLNLVHQADPAHPTLITVQGFVIKDQNRILMQRALIGGKVQASDLRDYLKNLMNKQKHKKTWPLIGVNLNQVL